jgi:hypothetical protein
MEKTLRGASLSDAAGFVYSLALVALALMGMAGLLYHTLTPNGSIGSWAGRLWTSHPVFTTLVLVGLIAMALTARSPRLSHQGVMGRSNVPLYIFVAFGMFFAARWLVSGTL